MANLKEIRSRMTSVKTTRQVTSAMKMVSAAKLRRAQNAVVRIRPYADKLYDIQSKLSFSLDNIEDNPYAKERGSNKVLLVAITSNRGLCGGFNANIVRKVDQLISDEFNDQYTKGNLDILSIGKKGYDVFRRGKHNLSEMNSLYDNLDFDHVDSVAQNIMNQFIDEKYDKVYLIFNQFKNSANQDLTAQQFLPIVSQEQEINKNSQEYIFEPSKDTILKNIIPKSLKIQFYKALLDSNAAEHGARMTAMHKATDNATDLLKSLNLEYNKARQAAITGQILEIVGGAEALNG